MQDQVYWSHESYTVPGVSQTSNVGVRKKRMKIDRLRDGVRAV